MVKDTATATAEAKAGFAAANQTGKAPQPQAPQAPKPDAAPAPAAQAQSGPQQAVKAAPHGDLALRLSNHMLNHFADRSDVGKLTTAQFHNIAESVGLMHRTGYDPKKHAYLKPYAESRNLVAGDEVLAYTDDGEALIDAAGKLKD